MESKVENPPFHDKARPSGSGGSSSMAPPDAFEDVQASPFNLNKPTEELSKDDKFFGIVILSLRAIQIQFSFIGSAAAVSTRRVHYIKRFAGVFCLDVIVCFYAIIMLILSLIHYSSMRKSLSPPTWGAAKLTFVLDQVLAYALLGAVGKELRYKTSHISFVSFYSKHKVFIFMSLLAFVFLAASAALYPVRLLKVTKR